MQQDRNKSRRPSSSIQQNSARRQGKPRKAYDWTQDRRPSNQDRRRTQGYQEQTLDFSGGNVTFENHSSGYADNSIQFPQQTARRPNNQNQSRRIFIQCSGAIKHMLFLAAVAAEFSVFPYLFATFHTPGWSYHAKLRKTFQADLLSERFYDPVTHRTSRREQQLP